MVRSRWHTTRAVRPQPHSSPTKDYGRHRQADTSWSSTRSTHSSQVSPASNQSTDSAAAAATKPNTPDPQDYDPVTTEEVEDAVDAAQACVSASERQAHSCPAARRVLTEGFALLAGPGPALTVGSPARVRGSRRSGPGAVGFRSLPVGESSSAASPATPRRPIATSLSPAERS